MKIPQQREGDEIVTLVTAKETVKKTVAEKVKLDPPVKLTCDDRIKKWAWENAYMLVTIFILFLATWIYMGVLFVILYH
jgi:hypothetical protein